MTKLQLPGMSIGRSIASVVVALLIMILIAIPFAIAGSLSDEWIAMPYYFAAMGLSVLAAMNLRGLKISPSSFDLRPPALPVLLLVALGGFAILFGILRPIHGFIPMDEAMEEWLMQQTTQVGVPTFITFVVLAPVLEELLFRGVILDGLLRKHSPAKSILVSSLLFGALHLNLVQFATGLLLGGFAGWVYHRSRSLAACIAIHATANGSGYLLRLVLAQADPEDLESLKSMNSLDDPWTWVSFVLGGIATWWSVRTLARRFDRSGPRIQWSASREARPAEPGPALQ